jgi:hypothetical protein
LLRKKICSPKTYLHINKRKKKEAKKKKRPVEMPSLRKSPLPDFLRDLEKPSALPHSHRPD